MCLLMTISGFLIAQEDEVLFIINNKKIYQSEFIASFNKNISYSISENIDSTRKYLEKYIEFKLKVIEAENQGLDKKKEFIDKFDKYKFQLIKPYLTNQQLVEKLAKEEYERMKTEIHVRHILVSVSPFASPKDSLLAYQKAVKIQKRLNSGEDFGSVARQVSDDPQAINNDGDLWYVGPLVLPYSIENYLYGSMQPRFSNPIRSRFGYHIIEIVDKRNNPGLTHAAHILIALTNSKNEFLDEKSKLLADSVYQLIQSGQDFSTLAVQYSDDNGTLITGGELPWFETGSMPHEFETASLNLTFDGAVSKPIKTRFGYHIIKRLEKKNIPTYQQIKDQLILKITSSDQGEIVFQQSLADLKKEYAFTDSYTLSLVIDMVDSTIFENKWKMPEYVDLSTTLFSFDNQNVSHHDFLKYLEETQIKMLPIPMEIYVNLKYNEFIKEKLIFHEENMLIKKNNSYRLLLNEFREGLLYDEIMEKEIWDKANGNQSSVEEYYIKNKSRYNNLYQADVSIFDYSILEPSKIEKFLVKYKEQNLDDQEIVLKIKSNIDKQFKLVERLNAIEGKSPIFDKCIVKYKNNEFDINEKILRIESENKLIWFNSEIYKRERPYKEVEAIVLIDYLKNNDNLWVDELKKKYKVTINEDAFKSLF
jgi:peptidyl-prolyl cis-trans isomerase SurA